MLINYCFWLVDRCHRSEKTCECVFMHGQRLIRLRFFKVTLLVSCLWTHERYLLTFSFTVLLQHLLAYTNRWTVLCTSFLFPKHERDFYINWFCFHQMNASYAFARHCFKIWIHERSLEKLWVFQKKSVFYSRSTYMTGTLQKIIAE